MASRMNLVWRGGAADSLGALRLRGNRDDLTARVLVKSTCFRTSNRWLHGSTVAPQTKN